MPRDRIPPPEPAPPEAAAELSAALTASGLDLGTIFTARHRMADPNVLRLAEAMTRPGQRLGARRDS